MALRLPDFQALGERQDLKAGERALATVDLTGYGKGLAAIGAGLSGAGDSLAKVVGREASRKTEDERLRANSFLVEGDNKIESAFDVDPKWQTWQPRYTDQKKKNLEAAAALISNPREREHFLLRAAPYQAAAQRRMDQRYRQRYNHETDNEFQTKTVPEFIEASRRVTTPEEKDFLLNQTLAPKIQRLVEAGVLTPSQGEARKREIGDAIISQEFQRRPYAEQAQILRRVMGIPDPAARSGAIEPEAKAAIDAAAQEAGIDPKLMYRMAQIESAGGRDLQRPGSQYAGLFQFGDAAWKRFGEGDRMDPVANAKAAARYIAHNEKYLTERLGRPPAPWELYLAHQQGEAGAANLLANPDAPASSVVPREHIVKNGGDPNMTAGEFADMWRGKFDRQPAVINRAELETRLKGFVLPGSGATREDAFKGVADDNLDRMSKFVEAAKEAGHDLKFISVMRNDAQQAAARLKNPSAAKGRSKHQDGLAADMSFGSPAAQKWAHDNAEKFGLAFPHKHDPREANHMEFVQSDRPQPRSAPERMAAMLSPGARLALLDAAEKKVKESDFERKSFIDTSFANAIEQIKDTGIAPPTTPSLADLIERHGEARGRAAFDQLQQVTQFAKDVKQFGEMTDPQAKAFIAKTAPVKDSPTYAADSARHQQLNEAYKKDREFREKDPFMYTVRAHPAMAATWKNLNQNDPNAVREALAKSYSIQDQIGIPAEKRMLMPKEVMDAAKKAFDDEALPHDKRVAALTSLLFATNDPQQRQRIMAQMEAAGVDGMWRGVFDATARGDIGAARRLSAAAMMDATKLPGPIGAKTADIQNAILTELMAPGKIGDVVYGVRAGVAENGKRAADDGRLIERAVKMELALTGTTGISASTVTATVKKVLKDRFGDVKSVVKDDALFVLPSDSKDEAAILAGLRSIAKTEIKDAVTRKPPLPPNATPEQKRAYEFANLDVARSADDLVATGQWRMGQGGFVFIDPTSGLAATTPDGKVIVVPMAKAIAAGKNAKPDTGGPSGTLDVPIPEWDAAAPAPAAKPAPAAPAPGHVPVPSRNVPPVPPVTVAPAPGMTLPGEAPEPPPVDELRVPYKTPEFRAKQKPKP